MRSNKNTLKHVLSETFTGLIWKIKINEETGVMGIESRNSDLKQVAFSILNFQSGKINFKEKTYDEIWNLSLAYIGKENLIINGYEHSDSPANKGIMSVRISDGGVNWQKFNVSLNHVREEGLEVYDSKIQPRKYFWIDHLSAETIVSPDQNTPVRSSIILPEVTDSFVVPEFIIHQKISGEFFFLSYKNIRFISFHEVIDNFMHQRLIVYQEDTILLDDILISGIQKLQPEAFFIQQNHLFYIRNKKELISYLV